MLSEAALTGSAKEAKGISRIMALEFKIYPDRRLVVARGVGTLTDPDVFNYQRDVWSRPDVQGFDELMDMTAVEEVELPSLGRARQLASLSAGMDPGAKPSKFAIVAVSEVHYGLARMYSTWRASDPRSTKTVQVFRSKNEALAWLGVTGALEDS